MCSSDLAGKAAADFALGRSQVRNLLPLSLEGDLLSAVPQYLDLSAGGQAVVYFRAARTMAGATVSLKAGDQVLFRKRYAAVRPPEMERIVLDLGDLPAGAEKIELSLRG